MNFFEDLAIFLNYFLFMEVLFNPNKMIILLWLLK